ncbi:hypothetical protein [Sphingobacterium endophyticum]|uniref:hypothetical protein n=1 Tax=Sphingobacterium endophyticum TaxID=2546448 RepID=UPI0012E2E192|nr:hypothetical protein [Sphingobacterium endophyticum]
MDKKYTSPRIEVYDINLEEGIASGSAFVHPQNGENDVMEQWYEDDQQTKNIDWF